jgi:hypothetical protein
LGRRRFGDRHGDGLFRGRFCRRSVRGIGAGVRGVQSFRVWRCEFIAAAAFPATTAAAIAVTIGAFGAGIGSAGFDVPGFCARCAGFAGGIRRCIAAGLVTAAAAAAPTTTPTLLFAGAVFGACQRLGGCAGRECRVGQVLRPGFTLWLAARALKGFS